MKLRKTTLLALVLGVGIGLVLGEYRGEIWKWLAPRDEVAGLVEGLRGDYKARRAAERDLVRQGPRAVPALIAATGSADPVLRWEAVNTLGRIGDPGATDALVSRVLQDEDVHVRWRSIWAIAALEREAVASKLLVGLQNPDRRTSWNAAVALAALGRREGLAILYEGLKGGGSFARWEAANALGAVHDERAVPALVEALEDPDASVAGEAALGLGRIGDRQAVPALLGALDSPEAKVRMRAAMALGRLGDTRAAAKLEQALARETDTLARPAVAEALRRLGARAAR